MRNLKGFLMFGLGCVTAFALNFATGANAQRGKGGTANALQSRLAALEQRARDLEQGSAGALPARKVVAPFEVTDEKGQRIFYVDADGANVYRGGKRLATMGGHRDGGLLFATTENGYYSLWLDTAAGAPSFSVVENNAPRVVLGKGEDNGTYRLKFLSGANQNVAGIGEDLKTQTGLALIFDKSGNLKARMAISDDGKGLIDVLGANKLPIVQLTEGSHKGGRLLICSARSCDPALVEAGDAGGYGIVRAGPQGFNPGVTMLGLPGSVIAGKQ